MPTTTGLQVVDAWPAMSLRLWCRDDIYYSQQTMDGLFDSDSAVPLTDVLADEKKLNAKIAEIRDCYRNVEMIAPRADELFEADMLKYPNNRPTHTKHVNETDGYRAIARAESKLFDALVKWQTRGSQDDRPGEKRVPRFASGLRQRDCRHLQMGRCDVSRGGQLCQPGSFGLQALRRALKYRKAGIENLLKANPTDKLDMSFLQEEVVER